MRSGKRKIRHDAKREAIVCNLQMEIEELRRLQREAEDSQRTYFELFNLALFAFFVLDTGGTILEANEFAAGLLKEKNRRNLLGQRFGKFVAKKDQGRWSEYRKEVFRSGESVENEMTFVKKNGVFFPARLNAKRGQDMAGTPRKMWLGVTDITVWKNAEAVLQRDKEMLDRIVKDKTFLLQESQEKLGKAIRLSDIGTLSSTIAHELRNPLAAIKMAAFNIRKKGTGLCPASLETIEKKVDESDRIINNLLFYSRLKQPMMEQVDIGAIVSETVKLTRALLGRKQIRISEQLEGLDHFHLYADPVQLQEVFHNVINNAFEAVNEKNGLVTVLGSKKDSLIEVTVEDNGAGINKEHLEKIFDPFFTTKSRGTGLGLTVSKQIVEMHRGDLEVKSEPGKGTRVHIRLPVKD